MILVLSRTRHVELRGANTASFGGLRGRHTTSHLLSTLNPLPAGFHYDTGAPGSSTQPLPVPFRSRPPLSSYMSHTPVPYETYRYAHPSSRPLTQCMITNYMLPFHPRIQNPSNITRRFHVQVDPPMPAEAFLDLVASEASRENVGKEERLDRVLDLLRRHRSAKGKLDLPLLRPLPRSLPERGGLPLPRVLGPNRELELLPEPDSELLDFHTFLCTIDTRSQLTVWSGPSPRGRGRPTRSSRGRGRGCNNGRSNLSSVVNSNSPSTLLPFNNAFPGFMYKFIQNWKNVISDGNCGCRKMSYDLHHHMNMYVQLFGSLEPVHELLKKTNWEEGSAPYEHWMDTLDHLYAIASTSNFCVLQLRDGCPLPLMQVQWQYHRDIRVTDWTEPYHNRTRDWWMCIFICLIWYMSVRQMRWEGRPRSKRFVLDLDQVDRGHSTVGRLGPGDIAFNSISCSAKNQTFVQRALGFQADIDYEMSKFVLMTPF
ncbi:hypothetical protein M9H77_22087 [Catharanthus roseus]|uniref:Uncharacterized protein n=1 Tax=Catharanthus roseus TaxID=4058 RepID=A0ACC0AQE6_CATRO|nr:hypothetical protein M9H77_22087 [Catharanthus roseus]